MFAAALFGALFLLPGCLGSPCPCGQTYDDPFDPGARIGASHPTDIHCVCACGEDEPRLEPPAVACEGYELPCRDRAGREATITCR